MIRDIREATSALGTARFGPSPSEVNSLKFRRSLRAVNAVKAGEVITEHNVRSVRPAGGLPPDDFSRIAGMKATRDIAVGEPITDDLVK
jgi:N-acetylneuraminate synthase